MSRSPFISFVGGSIMRKFIALLSLLLMAAAAHGRSMPCYDAMGNVTGGDCDDGVPEEAPSAPTPQHDDRDPAGQVPLSAPAPDQAARDEALVQQCEQRLNELTRDFDNKCSYDSAILQNKCEWAKSTEAREIKDFELVFIGSVKAELQSANGQVGQKSTCMAAKCYAKNSRDAAQRFKTNCKPLADNCVNSCNDLLRQIDEFNSGECGRLNMAANLAQAASDTGNTCNTFFRNQNLKADVSRKLNDDIKRKSEKCVASVSSDLGDLQCPKAGEKAAEGDAEDLERRAKAAGVGDGTGDGTKGGTTTAGVEDTDDSDKDKDQDKKKDDKKKQANNNSNPLGALAGIAGALMNGAAAKNAAATATTPIAPMELASDDCRRPERANSDICFCSNPANVRSQRCMGGNSASYNSTFGNPLQGVGGAKLANPTTGPTLNLPSSIPDPGYIGAGNKDGGGGGGGQGMLGGGGYGGLNPGNPNQKPDPPPAKAKSALSADILVGVRGGTNPFGPRGPSAPRVSGAYGMPRDPDELKGYNLKADNNPNLQRFLPNRGTAAEGPGQIAGSAAYGVGGIHTADKNIFNEMTNRYRALEDSLLP